MAYTRHGHHIPGTLKGEGVAKAPAPHRCGGVAHCMTCKGDMFSHLESVTGNGEDLQMKAKEIVKAFIDKVYTDTGAEPPVYELYVPWFSKTLKNWKATVGTTIPDGHYFELTYDGDKRVTYLDFYRKVENVAIPDKPRGVR